MMMAALTAAALLACVGSAAADDFCTDYSLSPCADTPYHANHTAMFGQPCPAHLATLSVYQQTCVKYYLQFASFAESSHCDKARGEGPCAPGGTMQGTAWGQPNYPAWGQPNYYPQATNYFCDNYFRSDCAGVSFQGLTGIQQNHTCPEHYNMMTVAQQACVVTHLNFAAGDASGHCAHARGEGPCAPGGTMQPPPPRKVSGASSAAASGGALALAAWLVL